MGKSDLDYKYLDQAVHNTLKQKLDNEQLQGSRFVFQEKKKLY